MKEMYETDRESLYELSKKIYEEACLGYMDLKESICERLVEEFLQDKLIRKNDSNTNLNSMAWTVAAPGNWDGGIGVPSETTITVGSDPILETAGIVISAGEYPLNSDVAIRNPDQDMLRANYYGNESERM